MPKFSSEGIDIAYDVYGEGPPVVLVHGFASSGKVNWVDTGWVETLNAAGYQAITMDNRGHGESEKLYDPDRYTSREMAGDAANLVDHLQLGSAAFMGYSMGARICAFVAMNAPEKVRVVIFGGLAGNMTRGLDDADEIIDGLLAGSLDDVKGRNARQFRIFADRNGGDRRALAACMATSRDEIAEDDIRRIDVPALVAVGSKDDIAGAPEPFAALLPRGEVLVIERRDHMRATGDKQYKQGVLEFLHRHDRLISLP